jgi:tRNA(Ile)-lysidine synthase
LEHGHLRFLAPKEGRQSGNGCGYEYRLRVPGQVRIAEIGKRISAACVSAGEAESRYNRAQLLDSQLLSSELVVRSWRPGDRFWPAHTKSPKKVKELLQERRVPAGERALWPVVASGENLIWMRGFPVPAQFAPAGDDAVLIQEQDEEPDE